MKKYLALLALVCGASVTLAADYDLVNDWVFQGPNNPNGAWSYGAKLETELGSGIFATPFQLATTHDTANASWDRWVVSGTADTCVVWAVPDGLWTFPANSVILSAWVNYGSAVHWAGEAGTYNLSAAFQIGGYATPTETYPNSRVYVIKNDTMVLFEQQIFGFGSASSDQEITMASGDWLDFIVAGNPDARSSLDASLTLVPEPSSLGLLALGGLLIALRKQR